MFMQNEDDYNKILKENQTIKKEIKESKESKHSTFRQSELEKIMKSSSIGGKKYSGIHEFEIQKLDKSGKINLEYLKNVTLKYLEAIAIGNEFQTKILENVIFSVLGVTISEKSFLDDKRNKGSFYYNLWYNAKAYLTSKIYGNSSLDDSRLSYNAPMRKGSGGIIEGSGLIDLNSRGSNIIDHGNRNFNEEN